MSVSFWVPCFFELFKSHDQPTRTSRWNGEERDTRRLRFPVISGTQGWGVTDSYGLKSSFQLSDYVHQLYSYLLMNTWATRQEDVYVFPPQLLFHFNERTLAGGFCLSLPTLTHLCGRKKTGLIGNRSMFIRNLAAVLKHGRKSIQTNLKNLNPASQISGNGEGIYLCHECVIIDGCRWQKVPFWGTEHTDSVPWRVSCNFHPDSITAELSWPQWHTHFPFLSFILFLFILLLFFFLFHPEQFLFCGSCYVLS